MNNYAYLGDHIGLAITADGNKILLDTRELKDLSIITHGTYEINVMPVLKYHIKKGDHVVDVGANIGYHSILAASLVGRKGMVFSFEPNPYVFELLKKSIKINGFNSRVKLYQKAVFNKITKVQLTWNQLHGGGRLVVSGKEQLSDKQIEVDTIPLDDVIKDEFLPIDLMKIDVEGTEPYVIEGAKKILEQSPNLKIIMEWDVNFMKSHGYDVEKLINFLKGLDFSIDMIKLPDLERIKIDDLFTIKHCELLFS